MKKLVVLLFLLSMAVFGTGIKGVSQKGDYCTFKVAPKIDETSYIISDAKCVIKGLDYDVPDLNADFHYQSYGGEKFDVEILFFNLVKKADLRKIRQIEFEDGIKITGSGHTGRINLGNITKFNISKNTLKIIQNDNENYKD